MGHVCDDATHSRSSPPPPRGRGGGGRARPRGHRARRPRSPNVPGRTDRAPHDPRARRAPASSVRRAERCATPRSVKEARRLTNSELVGGLHPCMSPGVRLSRDGALSEMCFDVFVTTLVGMLLRRQLLREAEVDDVAPRHRPSQADATLRRLMSRWMSNRVGARSTRVDQPAGRADAHRRCRRAQRRATRRAARSEILGPPLGKRAHRHHDRRMRTSQEARSAAAGESDHHTTTRSSSSTTPASTGGGHAPTAFPPRKETRAPRSTASRSSEKVPPAERLGDAAKGPRTSPAGGPRGAR